MTGLSPLWAPRKEEGQVKTREESDNASSQRRQLQEGARNEAALPSPLPVPTPRQDPISLTPVVGVLQIGTAAVREAGGGCWSIRIKRRVN